MTSTGMDVELYTAESLGERNIIRIIWEQLSKAPGMSVPFGDDVSAIEFNEHDLVVKTDMLVGRTDVPAGMSYSQAARKAVVMNVSDFASKGAKPLGLVVSLGIPRSLTQKEIKRIGKGLNDGAREYEAYVLGGDTNETSDLIISVAIFGVPGNANLTLRDGAQPGDILATTGPFGLTSSGLRMLKEKLPTPTKIKKKLADSVLMPHARLKEGLALAKIGAATASIDSSDGLAWSLHEISRASNVGFIIDNPPIANEAREFAKLHNLDPLELSLYGGEEYELILTIKPSCWREAREAVIREGGDLIRIGETVANKTLLIKQKSKLVKIEARGYEHFKN